MSLFMGIDLGHGNGGSGGAGPLVMAFLLIDRLSLLRKEH
jgi:hypothetical protein